MEPMDTYQIDNIPSTAYYIPNFITEEEERNILKNVYAAPKPKWTVLSNRRLQNWGGLPHPKGMIAETIPNWLAETMERTVAIGAFPKEFSPNHVLVNEYEPGQGILPHLDGPLFHPTISNVTCGSHTVLNFHKNNEQEVIHMLLLERRSLVVLKEDLYHNYQHSISEITKDCIDENIANLNVIHKAPAIGDIMERGTRNKVRSMINVSSGGFALFAGFSLYNESEQFYENCLIPALQCLNPEDAHRLSVIAAKYKLIPPSRYEDPKSLRTEVLGLKFNNPVGLAAGFDKDGEAVPSLLKIGFGFVEIGSITPLPQPGNEKPRVFRLQDNSAVINRYGFNSEGHEAVLDRLRKLRSDKDFKGILGVNLGKNKTSQDPVQDYVLGIKLFASLADYLVINISSPNTPGLRNWQKKEQLETLLGALVEARNSQSSKTPLLLKLSPDLTVQERADIAQVIQKPQCKVDGLIISNTTVERPGISQDEGVERGGLSGAPLHAASTQLIRDMYKFTQGKVPIIGVGGVFSGKDALEKVEAGASLIQLYTAFSYHGPPRITRVKKELDLYLREKGYSTLSEAVGAEHKLS